MEENMNNLKPNLGQFKLGSGETIVAEVIEDGEVRCFRKVLSVTVHEDVDDGVSFYALRLYTLFQDDINQNIFINPMHVESTTRPAATIVNQYNKWWDVYESKSLNSDDMSEICDSLDEMITKSSHSAKSFKDMYSLDSSGVIRINKDKLN
mgnify:CR=1 FL=1